MEWCCDAEWSGFGSGGLNFGCAQGLGALAVAWRWRRSSWWWTALDGLARYARATGARAFAATLSPAQIATAGQKARDASWPRSSSAISAMAGRTEVPRRPRRRRKSILRVHGASGVVMSPQGPGSFENAQISGTTPTLAEAAELGIGRAVSSAPRRPSAAHRLARHRRDIAEELFPRGDAAGAVHPRGGRRFEVVGIQLRLVLSRGASSIRFVWMPLHHLLKPLRGGRRR